MTLPPSASPSAPGYGSTSDAGAAPPSAQELADPRHAKAWAAARDFEAMTLGQLLAPMFDTVDPSQGPLCGGAGESAWRPMLVQEIAKTMTRHGGIGLAGPVYRQLLTMQEVK